MAAPLVKPLVTGCPRRFTRAPKFSMLPTSWNTPTSRDARKATAAY